MRKHLTPFLVLIVATMGFVPPASASPYELILCPMVAGQFLLRNGELWIAIVKEDGKPVAKRTEKIANPLDDRSHEVLVKRGNVKVEVHQDKQGGLFVHWGTLADDE